MARSSNTGTVKALVLTDVYAYREPVENTIPTEYRRVEVPFAEGKTSSKGVEYEFTADEFERGSNLTPPALAKVGSKEAKLFLGQSDAAEQAAPDPLAVFAQFSDDDLAAIVAQRGGDPKDKSREDLLAFLTA